jgi:2-polyprenyl-6-methoxyphenol hydroxylase-like FAD-dependent oxidoreductase
MPEPRADWKAVFTYPSGPSDSRCGYLVPVEGNLWMVSITELHCQRPPRDLAEFLDAARGLRTRTIYDAISTARPAGMPQRFGFPASTWRHYETLAGFPERLIPIGDALCRFNPVYAQGMSVAAREASILADLLERRARGSGALAGLPRDFLAEVQPWIAGTWSMSATPDLAYAQTSGERPADLEDALAFGAALLRVAARDPEVHELLVAVRTLARPHDALHDPGLVDCVRAEMAAVSLTMPQSVPLAA